MITKFQLDWDGDRAADYPKEYQRAIENELVEQLKYEEYARQQFESAKLACLIAARSQSARKD
jgi:hypothetical protein